MEVAFGSLKEYTIEDYLKLGEDFHGQLIQGKLIMSLSPSFRHQNVCGNLFMILNAFAAKTNGKAIISPFDVFLDTRNVLQPDLIFISKQNLKRITDKGIEGSPDLVVEVLSPSNSHIDRYQKRELYQKFEVKEYWIVDPKNQSIEILNFALDAHEPVLYAVEEGEVRSSLFPELTFELSTIF